MKSYSENTVDEFIMAGQHSDDDDHDDQESICVIQNVEKSDDLSYMALESSTEFSTNFENDEISESQSTTLSNHSQTTILSESKSDWPSFSDPRNTLEFKIVLCDKNGQIDPNQSHDEHLKPSDLDRIIMFLKNFKLTSGNAIEDYKVNKLSQKIVVMYKDDSVRDKMLHKHIFRIQSDESNERYFRLIANQVLPSIETINKDLTKSVIMIQTSEDQHDLVKNFCNNLINNNEKTTTEIEFIKESSFFPNTFIVGMRDDQDESTLDELVHDIGFDGCCSIRLLSAYRTRIIAVRLFDQNGTAIPQELVELYFSNEQFSRCAEKFSQVYLYEPFLLLQYEKESTCEQLARTKHHILGHELSVEYLYNSELLSTILTNRRPSSPKRARIFLDEFRRIKWCSLLWANCFVALFGVIFLASFLMLWNLDANYTRSHEFEQTLHLPRHMFYLLNEKMLHDTINSKAQFNGMSIELRQKENDVVIRGREDQVKRIIEGIQSEILDSALSEFILLDEFQTLFFVIKESGVLSIPFDCKAFKLELDISPRVVIYARNARQLETCARLFKSMLHKIEKMIHKQSGTLNSVLVEYLLRVNSWL